MARYTGPRAKMNRRLGGLIFENTGAGRAYDRRPEVIGVGGRPRRGKSSTYGMALTEKQKIKYYYGLGERQLRRYFDMARRMKGNTGGNLLVLCERRMDNVVRRAGFTFTRAQARQGIVHGHFLLNGRKCDIPSVLLRPGDVISVKNRSNVLDLYRGIMESQPPNPPDWITLDQQNMTATVSQLPDAKHDISLPVEIGPVVEFMSR